MKATLSALFFALLMIGCEEDSGPHLDAPESLNKAVLEKLILGLKGVKREWNYMFGKENTTKTTSPTPMATRLTTEEILRCSFPRH